MARIVTRQGLLGKSFAQAAEAISDALGCAMNRESVRQLTQDWGAKVEMKRQEMAEQLFVGDSPAPAMPVLSNPIEKQASISTDGRMILIRQEGWKEVKLVAISSVRAKTASERSDTKGSRRYAPWEPQMMIEQHSYQAGLWEANTAGQHQYVEALRRGCPNALRSVRWPMAPLGLNGSLLKTSPMPCKLWTGFMEPKRCGLSANITILTQHNARFG